MISHRRRQQFKAGVLLDEYHAPWKSVTRKDDDLIQYCDILQYCDDVYATNIVNDN